MDAESIGDCANKPAQDWKNHFPGDDAVGMGKAAKMSSFQVAQ